MSFQKNNSFLFFGGFLSSREHVLFDVLGICFEGVMFFCCFLFVVVLLFGVWKRTFFRSNLYFVFEFWVSLFFRSCSSYFMCLCLFGVFWVLLRFFGMFFVNLRLSFLHCSVLMLFFFFISCLGCPFVCVVFLGLPFPREPSRGVVWVWPTGRGQSIFCVIGVFG